jgi:hypothetical protein
MSEIIALKKEILVMRLMKPILFAVLGAFFVMGVVAESAHAIPPFARKYSTSCTTCHIAVPRLNAFGRAFRLNGYFWPTGGDTAMTKYAPVEMAQFFGARSSIDAFPPVGFFLQSRAGFYPKRGNRSQSPETTSIDDFAIDLLTGGTVGDSIGYIFGFANDPGAAGFALESGYIDFVKLAGGHAVNLRVGLGFRGLRSDFPAGSLGINKASSESLSYATVGSTASNTFRTGRNGKPGLELYGIIMGRLHYNFGLYVNMPGDRSSTFENNYQKHFGGFIEYQIMGMKLDGEGGAVSDASWQDNHIKLRAFGAFGTSNTGTSAAPVNRRDTDFGGEIEVWWSMIQFLAIYENITKKTETFSGSGVYDKVRETLITAELHAILMNAAVIPVIRMDWIAPKVTLNNGAEQKSQGMKRLDFGANIQIRANVQFRIGANLILNASDLNKWANNGNGGGNYTTFDSVQMRLNFGW